MTARCIQYHQNIQFLRDFRMTIVHCEFIIGQHDVPYLCFSTVLMNLDLTYIVQLMSQKTKIPNLLSPFEDGSISGLTVLVRFSSFDIWTASSSYLHLQSRS